MQPEQDIPAGLPSPDADSLRHADAVAAYIRERIAESDGAISFGEFMQHALYAPGLGYYAAGARKFGAGGDFVTAPEVSPLFGRVLAAQIAPLLATIDGASILEIGAGSGALAISVLDRLAELDALPERYLIFDVSADLIERQRLRLEEERPELAARVTWTDTLPAGFAGVVIANEVADALPVERFERTGHDDHAIRQLYVGDDGGRFAADYRPASEIVVEQVLALESHLGRRFQPVYRSELSLGLSAWVSDIIDSVEHGVVLIFDYGLPRSEYYAADRALGWLRCHFRHHAHSQPLIFPGIQDITCWVDFTTIAEAGVQGGAELAGFVTQAMFLLNGGLDNEFASFDTLALVEQLELARQAKLLTMPDEMGEHFKCIGLTKGDTPIPEIFANGSRLHAL